MSIKKIQNFIFLLILFLTIPLSYGENCSPKANSPLISNFVRQNSSDSFRPLSPNQFKVETLNDLNDYNENISVYSKITFLEDYKCKTHHPPKKSCKYLVNTNFTSIFNYLTKTSILSIHHLGNNNYNKQIKDILSSPSLNEFSIPEISLKNRDPSRNSVDMSNFKNLSQTSLSRSNSRKSLNRNFMTFQDDERIELNELQSYRDNNQKYSRGHLTPSGDFDNPEDQIETFTTSNIAPQVQHTFNDRLWNELEQCIRKVTGDDFDGSYTIITGVIHNKDVSTHTLNNEISIPTHFYKIVIDEHLFPPKVHAFLMENRTYSPNETDSLAPYLTSVHHIEELSGIKFFDSIPPFIQNKIIFTKENLWEICHKPKKIHRTDTINFRSIVF